ncbi:Lysophospholipase L1 [Granulicella pectinivorans]|uniref:Lysophospholipase L1 n=1 Tax=Granulicella pectinivorans TaxID=474950 RepID=A0A1I6MEE7_9BACT|nr:rhamnogalacturonan acetylesterase [Granulicella pectinivorans]SFS13988.1 Lysophospholipase L1 [Granulicella pectinivorans]
MRPRTLLLAVLLLPALLRAQTDPKTVPMEGSTTDPAAHARIGLKPPANPKLPTLFLVGDSTVRNGKADGAGGQWGWGEPLADLFDLTKINVDNRAIGGRSSRSYIMEGQWQETLALVKPGDIILFQWGHNDDGPLDDPARARGTIKGIGDETKDIYNPILKINETVHSYGWYLRKYVVDTINAGATPILCSPIPRKTWKNGKVVRNADSYGGWAKAIATEQHIAFIDLNEIIARQYDALGEAAVEPMFADPHTHTSRAGAELNAAAVVAGLKALNPDPAAPFFSGKAKDIQPFKP